MPRRWVSARSKWQIQSIVPEAEETGTTERFEQTKINNDTKLFQFSIAHPLGSNKLSTLTPGILKNKRGLFNEYLDKTQNLEKTSVLF